jgi:hypothetical protein
VFGRPVGANQGVQFPIAQAYMQVRAADLMRYEAAALFDAGRPCGPEANMAKLLVRGELGRGQHLPGHPRRLRLRRHLRRGNGAYGFVDTYDVEHVRHRTRLPFPVSARSPKGRAAHDRRREPQRAALGAGGCTQLGWQARINVQLRSLEIDSGAHTPG